ncbi:helix-turn-helix domain-containing protein [Elizabethkingia anophelis]|uniref:helix-turn-helix domain-containing protein n=1 Tax=Elizabethkingia anophelis TaxID=1117645 RepID=UPI0016299011|nr:helix-turn-helix transcriptional regulator [Elizabethkingia anophelis]MCT4323134.1 helix-turn-helix transcriptional regulator [Elizabethkingia anophelis]HAY3535618.1 helix-turn-helix transcriptional regulator [Elizabethkingia anophelis]HAY3547733.1 helix-turn-helix transcriptional regulator [Elizabethkingia anophelis]HAY3592554.1 helix-turn-helix transcriptional regulator [Elizabethkingia anophelis]
MIHTDMPNKKIHQGRNIKRFREMLGIKQDALAYELGEDWNQKKISLLEQKESVEKDILEQVAKILKVPTEAIENFDEDSVINIISNTFNEGSIANATAENIQCTFNPIDKIVVLYDEKIALYERMLKEKDDMMARLEKLVQRK